MQTQNTTPATVAAMQILLPNGQTHNVPQTPATTGQAAPTPAPTTGATVATLQAQQAKLQAQIAALQTQQAQVAALAASVGAGQYYIVNPSNAQTNVGVQNLPKAVTLILQLLPLVTGSTALLPAQQATIAQLLLQAGSLIETQGGVPLARQRIAQA